MVGPERPSNGRPRQRRSSSSYNQRDQAVLLRPIEPKQYLAIVYSERLEEAGIAPSVGTVGDSYDNALAETVNGLYKTECTIPRGPWRNAADLEIATATWVEFYNKLRLHGSLNRMAPAEFEAAYWEAYQ